MAPTQKTRAAAATRSKGFTLVEVLVAVTITGLIMVALGGTIGNTLAVREETRTRSLLSRDARFAMDRILRSVSRSRTLLVPLAEDANTPLRQESIIEPGFIAVTLDPELDRDLDGFADADNDRDGRVDEDLPADTTNDARPGVRGIDDDNSGFTDISLAGAADDDETGIVRDEDPINGLDDDGDGSIDEDPPADMNGDGAPGLLGIDDDGDGSVDEGSIEDDDEDGQTNEDWYDAVVYRLSGTDLIERLPNLSPADGTDYTERTIASGVEFFRVERLPRGTNRADLIEVTLRFRLDAETLELKQRVRVGGAL